MASTDVIGGGNIEPRAFEDEMRSAYLDYAMSVIVGRALPDVRDGLKPVHRRILYSMDESGRGPTRPYSKSAANVGDVMGQYHPHCGAPAVPRRGPVRHTGARLTRLAAEMLRDLDADTVDFTPNYDGSKREPLVLPSRFPNLLVNGSSGIAVGMATNIPPHNLREVTDSTAAD